MLTLWIANKNYSSWSLRPWVAMREAGIDFVERKIRFGDAPALKAFRALSPNGLVPMLEDGDIRVADSLAIIEHLAEAHPALWPEDRAARAFARSAAAMMHSGYAALRETCTMNVGTRARVRDMPPAALRDLDDLDALWTHGLATFGGPFLAGERFTAADAFFCPVAFRVQTYRLTVPGDVASAYVKRLLDVPSMQHWQARALAETFRDAPHEEDLAKKAEILEDLRISERPDS